MDLLATAGILGTVASVISLMLPLQGRRARVIHAAYLLAVVVAVGFALNYKSRLNRIRSVSRAAESLLADREVQLSSEAFVQASLAFLEQQRDAFPDAYARAQRICEVRSCLGVADSADGVRNLQNRFAQNDAAGQFRGILIGIAALNRP